MVQVEKKGICVLSFSETLNLESVHHPISQANSRNHMFKLIMTVHVRKISDLIMSLDYYIPNLTGDSSSP